MHQPEHNNEESLEAPKKLITALKRIPGHVPFIPPAVDEAVLQAARRQLRPEARYRFISFRFWRWAAAGVGLCVLAVAISQLNRSSINPLSNHQFAREDINHDGRVDILDAFALARQLKAGHVPPGLLDVNGDGVVDERDVTAIAAHAVQLPAKGGRS